QLDDQLVLQDDADLLLAVDLEGTELEGLHARHRRVALRQAQRGVPENYQGHQDDNTLHVIPPRDTANRARLPPARVARHSYHSRAKARWVKGCLGNVYGLSTLADQCGPPPRPLRARG